MRGSVADSAIDQLPYYSEEERYNNDKILDESYKRTKKLIMDHKQMLLRLADVCEMDCCHGVGGRGA